MTTLCLITLSSNISLSPVLCVPLARSRTRADESGHERHIVLARGIGHECKIDDGELDSILVHEADRFVGISLTGPLPACRVWHPAVDYCMPLSLPSFSVLARAHLVLPVIFLLQDRTGAEK